MGIGTNGGFAETELSGFMGYFWFTRCKTNDPSEDRLTSHGPPLAIWEGARALEVNYRSFLQARPQRIARVGVYEDGAAKRELEPLPHSSVIDGRPTVRTAPRRALCKLSVRGDQSTSVIVHEVGGKTRA